MKKLLATLLCLLLCASLACCATEQSENSVTSSESSETIENPLSEEKVLEVAKRYWNDYVVTRSKPVTEVAYLTPVIGDEYPGMMRPVCLKTPSEIDPVLDLCKTLDMDNLLYQGICTDQYGFPTKELLLGFHTEAGFRVVLASAIIFNLSDGIESGICLGFVPDDYTTTLLLWVNDTVYKLKVPCGSEFEEPMRDHFYQHNAED